MLSLDKTYSAIRRGIFIAITAAAIAVAHAGACLAGDADYPTIESSHIAWNFEQAPRRIVAVGDIHGDYNALVTILRGARLINARGKWIGGKTHLVLMGDLIGKGSDSRLVMDFMMRLEREVPGQVHSLLGNHELFASAGRYSAMTDDVEAFRLTGSEESLRRSIPETPEYLRDWRTDHSYYREIKAAFSKDSKYARWIRSRNAILKIGNNFFTHAGVLPEWAFDTNPGRVNATIRAWLAYYQGAGPRPPMNTRWVIEEETSPLSNRAYAPEGRGPDYAPKKIKKMLRALAVDRMFLGHYLRPDREILLEHPDYGDRVTILDSGISEFYDGTLSAVEIVGDEVTELTFDRPEDDVPLREREPAVRQLERLDDRSDRLASRLERIETTRTLKARRERSRIRSQLERLR